MHFLRSIAERRSTSGTASPAAWLLEALGGGKTASGQRPTPATAEGIPVVYACVGILAETVGQLPLKLYHRTAKGKEPATTHSLYSVLHDLPNPFMTAIEFRETMMRWLALWGANFAEIERRGSDVVGLWPLASDRMTVNRDKRGVLRYTYRLLNGGTQEWLWTDPDNPPLLHMTINSLDGGITGRSPITILRESLGITMAADQHAASFFGSGALPDIIISKKGPGSMNPKAKQNFIESWKERFGGSAKAHGIALLEEDFTVTPITMPMRDAQFLEVRSFQVEDGARTYRIPLSMLQHTGKETTWGTGVEQIFISFLNITMAPWLVRWEQAIARDCLTRKSFETHFARFSMQALMRGDSAARGTFYEKMLATGAMSPNDILSLEDMNGIGPDGDRRFVTANVKPLDAPAEPPPAAPAPTPAVMPVEDMPEGN